MSAGVGDESIEIVDPENLVVAVGISILSVMEQEIQLLPVWRPPSLIFRLLKQSINAPFTKTASPQHNC